MAERLGDKVGDKASSQAVLHEAIVLIEKAGDENHRRDAGCFGPNPSGEFQPFDIRQLGIKQDEVTCRRRILEPSQRLSPAPCRHHREPIPPQQRLQRPTHIGFVVHHQHG